MSSKEYGLKVIYQATFQVESDSYPNRYRKETYYTEGSSIGSMLVSILSKQIFSHSNKSPQSNFLCGVIEINWFTLDVDWTVPILAFITIAIAFYPFVDTTFLYSRKVFVLTL